MAEAEKSADVANSSSDRDGKAAPAASTSPSQADGGPPKPARLVPVPDPTTEPFWEATRERRLLAQQCGDCEHWVFYPRPVCPNCGSRALRWKQLSGRGTVYTFSVIHRPAHPGMAPIVPYVVALVDLDEGIRMMSNVVDCPPSEVRIGMRVEAVFEDLTSEITLPLFRPEMPDA